MSVVKDTQKLSLKQSLIMKSALFMLRAAISTLLVLALVGAAAFADSAMGLGLEAFELASLVPTALADPGIVKQWSQKYFQRVQSKSIFDEAYTGTTFSQDGPKKSDLVKAAPITLITDLQNRSGNVVTHTLIEPMFPDSESRMNYARLKQQVREGSEKNLNRKFVKVPLASGFWGIKEEDVLIGKQETGMANMVALMTKGLSDNVSAYMDDDTIEAFLTGYSRHLFATIAEQNSVADGSPVLGNADMGVVDTLREHPNTYAWTPTGMVKAASNSAEDVGTVFNQITEAATPGAAMLDSISLIVKIKKIPGIVLTGGKFGNAGKSMVKVVVDPLMMNKIRGEAVYRETVNSAYMSKGDDHPLIAQGDVLWGNLWVSEEEKLLDDNFSNKYSFDGEGFADGADEWAAPATIDVAGAKNTVERTVTVSKGERTYFGGGDIEAGDVANILVLGANSLARCPGPVLRLIPRTTDDYKRIIGLGSEHIFGHKRLDFIDASGAFAFNQSSLRIMAYRGNTESL